MGILISRFRRKPNTKERLESIEKELEDIDDFRFYTQQQQKRMVGSLIIYSVIVYIVAALVFYFYYFPSELSQQILYSLPLIVFPVIIWVIKQLLHWYYRYKLVQNEDKMVLLHREKKKLLKEVMEKETYKIAKEILEKYDPEQIQKKLLVLPTPTTLNAPDIIAKLPETELRRRVSTGSKGLPLSHPPQSSGASRPPAAIMPAPSSSAFVPPRPIRPGYNAPPLSYPRVSPLRPSGIPMRYPILPKQRGLVDRLVEYVVGDGPNNRYALICRHCHSHNGMALKEEFEFISFRCCYCYSFNPARKLRPQAPRLSLQPLPQLATEKDSSDSSGEEEEDSKVDGKSENGDNDQNTVSVTHELNKEQNNDLVQGLTIEELDTSDGSQTHVPDAVAEDMVTKPDVCDKDEELVKTADVILTDVPDDMEMDTNHECVSNSSEVSKNELGKSTSPIEEISAVDSLVTKD